MLKLTNYKQLAVGAIAIGALSIASVANAGTVQFKPGTAIQPQVDYSGAGQIDPDLTTGGAAVNVDEMNLIAYGNNLFDGAGNPDTTWNVFLDHVAGTFTETFTMSLQNTTHGNSVVETAYGNNFFGAEATYVTVVARLEGTIAADNTFPSGTNNAGLSLVYEDVAGIPGTPVFDWYFWDDGTAEDCGGAFAIGATCTDALIGTMDITSGTAKTVVNDPDGKSTLEWTGSFSFLEDGVLQINGTDLDETAVLAFTTNTITPFELVAGDNQTIEFDSNNNNTLLVFKVSEPGIMAVFGLGILGIGVAAHRRRRESKASVS